MHEKGNFTQPSPPHLFSYTQHLFFLPPSPSPFSHSLLLINLFSRNFPPIFFFYILLLHLQFLRKNCFSPSSSSALCLLLVPIYFVLLLYFPNILHPFLFFSNLLRLLMTFFQELPVIFFSLAISFFLLLFSLTSTSHFIVSSPSSPHLVPPPSFQA